MLFAVNEVLAKRGINIERQVLDARRPWVCYLGDQPNP